MEFVVEKETIDLVETNAISLKNGQANLLKNAIQKFCANDTSDSKVLVSSNNSDFSIKFEDFLNKDINLVDKEIDQEILINDGKPLEIFLTITKCKKNNSVPIYSMEKIIEFFITNNNGDELSFTSIANKLEECFVTNDNRNFLLINDSIEFYSESLMFGNFVSQETYPGLNLSKRMEKVKTVNDNSIYFGSPMNLVPEDFYLEKRSKEKSINDFFDWITLILCIMYISNDYQISENDLKISIRGFKNVYQTIHIDELKKLRNLEETTQRFINIYSWIYSSNESIVDRLGIARNIISLFLNGKNIYEIDEDIVPSLNSNYEIYLKENVNKYIDILNQVIILIRDLNEVASSEAQLFLKSFKNNFLGFFTFFVTTVLFNTISANKIENIFTRDITIITICMLAISGAYLIFSICEFNESISKVKITYERNKEFYHSLLSSEDINRIFSSKEGVRYEDDDIKMMKEMRCRVIALWLFTILAIFFTALYLHAALQ